MNKQILWLFLVLVVGYLSLVFCDESFDGALQSEKINEVLNESKELLDEEGRTRKRHRLFHLFWGWHALAIAYWIKVKVVIVSFFLGSAIFLGLRYFWPHKCASAVTHEGPIIYDHPPSFSHHHDHIPYSFDHHEHFDHSFDQSSFEPYSGYVGTYSDSAPTSVSESGPPDGHTVKRRSLSKTQERRQAVPLEEKIAELMFSFLGLDSKACRRRFICEMEFRSKLNPLSSMAFRIVGRGFFDKYTNARNVRGQASSFRECAAVNPDCVFIEESLGSEEEEQDSNTVTTEIALNSIDDKDSKTTSENIAIETEKENMELQNDVNISAERRQTGKRRRKQRRIDEIAERLFSQKL